MASAAPLTRRRMALLRTLQRWFDTAGGDEPTGQAQPGDRIDWMRALPFVLLHVGCLGVIWYVCRG